MDHTSSYTASCSSKQPHASQKLAYSPKSCTSISKYPPDNYSNKAANCSVIKLLIAKFDDVPERPYLQRMSNVTLGVQWLESGKWKHVVIRPIPEALHVHKDNGKGPAHQDNVSYQDEGDLEKQWKESDNYPEIHVHRYPETWCNSKYKSPLELAKLLSPDVPKLLDHKQVRHNMLSSVREDFSLDTSPLFQMLRSFLDGTFTSKHDCKQRDLQYCKITCQDVCRIPSHLLIPRELVQCHSENSLEQNLNRPLGTSVDFYIDECCSFAKKLGFAVKSFLQKHDLLSKYSFTINAVFPSHGKYGNILVNALNALGDLQIDPVAEALRNNILDWISGKDTTNSGIDFNLGDITILGSGRIVSNSTGSIDFKGILNKIDDLVGVTQKFKDVLIMAAIAFVSSRCIEYLE